MFDLIFHILTNVLTFAFVASRLGGSEPFRAVAMTLCQLMMPAAGQLFAIVCNGVAALVIIDQDVRLLLTVPASIDRLYLAAR